MIFWRVDEKYSTGIRSCKQGLVIRETDKSGGLRSCLLHQGCVCLLFLVISFCGQSLKLTNVCTVCLAVKTGRKSVCKLCKRANRVALTDPFDLILPHSSVYNLQHKLKTFKVEQWEYALTAHKSPNQFSGRLWHTRFWVNNPWDCVDQFQHPKLMEITYQLFLFNFYNFGTLSPMED